MIENRAVWSTAYVNSLPDSSFLLIVGSGSDKQRYFPVKDANGKVDEAHLSNALARIPQASTLSADQRAAAMTKAKALAKTTNVSGPKGTYAGSAGSGRSLYGGLQTLTFDVDLEIRDDGEYRTLLGRAVPYGETINLQGGEGKERFAYGAFANQVQAGVDAWQRVKLFDSHYSRLQGQQPIGKTAMLSERQDGLHGAWPLYATSKANDSLELVRTGEVTGLSIGFKAGKPQIGPDGAYERTAAHLDHIVLTHEPAYPGAMVTGIRSVEPEPHPIGGYVTSQVRHHQLIERLR